MYSPHLRTGPLVPTAIRVFLLACVSAGCAWPQAAVTPQVAPGAAPDTNDLPPVTTVLVDTDVRQALADIASTAGVMIVPDESVTGNVTVDLENVPFDKALKTVLLPVACGYAEVEKGVFIVTANDPEAPNFRRIATTQVLELEYIDGKELKALLPDAFSRFVKFDDGSSRVTVFAPKDLLEETIAQIELLDTQPAQVLIEALAVETTKDNADGFGASMQTEHESYSTDTGLMTYVGQTADILHQIVALVQKGKGTVRANPRVLAQHGETADIKVGTKRYFQIVTGRVGYEYTTLEAIEAAVSLNIVPRIAASGRKVTCVLKAEVSDVTGVGQNNLPIITSRSAQSTVTVGDGQVIAISGLRQEITRQRVSKIPVLGDIPIIGKLFQSTADESSQREIVIFIVPHILDQEGRFSGPLLLQTDVGRKLGLGGDGSDDSSPATAPIEDRPRQALRIISQEPAGRPQSPGREADAVRDIAPLRQSFVSPAQIHRMGER